MVAPPRETTRHAMQAWIKDSVAGPRNGAFLTSKTLHFLGEREPKCEPVAFVGGTRVIGGGELDPRKASPPRPGGPLPGPPTKKKPRPTFVDRG